MTKEEYEKIKLLLDQGKIDELNKYLDDRMDSKYINKARKAVMQIIDDDCETEYPSYYERVNLHLGIKKYYKGVITSTESGLIIFHKNSNLFKLYNGKILNETIEQIIERNAKYSHKKERNKIIESAQRSDDNLDKNFTEEVICSDNVNDDIVLLSEDENVSARVPGYYYSIAHKLLGDEVEEHIHKSGSGLYLKSPYGKAVIMSRVRKR